MAGVVVVDPVGCCCQKKVLDMKRTDLIGFFTLAVLAWSSESKGASVYNCSSQVQQCVVKAEDGIIGDRVKVLDERARVIAVGRILKKKGDYALISVTHASRHIRKGYPVIIDVEGRESSAQWTAAFSGN
jgi:hypothetical protein